MKNLLTLRFAFLALATSSVVGLTFEANAQTFPNRPIHLVVGYAVGAAPIWLPGPYHLRFQLRWGNP